MGRPLSLSSHGGFGRSDQYLEADIRQTTPSTQKKSPAHFSLKDKLVTDQDLNMPSCMTCIFHEGDN